MCGICGIIKFNDQLVSVSAIHSMMKAMKHRGPDDEGFYVNENIGLGFVRLSILDLSDAGRQPMFSEDNRYVLVFNGEVYNYLELREQLEQKGHVFKSRTDTEVVLAAYRQWGEACQDKFTGMWVFAVLDTLEKNIFIARDRFGIKPLYYYIDKQTLIFSSEIPSLLQTNLISPQANDPIIYDYLLTNRTNHSEETFFKYIYKLQHGHNLLIDLSNKRVMNNKWYFLENNLGKKGYITHEEFKNDFFQSIRLQLRSDVPVGICLSGGLDSSSIGAVIKKYFDSSSIHSFSAVYGQGQKGDEFEFIKEFQGYIDNIHFTTPTIDSLIQDLDSFIAAQAEPIPNSSAYAEYKVMELARNNGCKVLLNGQGVDEYMVGYHYLIGFLLKEMFFKFKWPSVVNEIYRYYDEHRSVLPVKYFIFLCLPFFIKEKILYSQKKYLSEEFFKEQSGQKRNSIVDQLYGARSLKDSLIKHFEYKFEHHLLWADKSGMSFSVETRFPFLDHIIVEKMLSTSNDLIYKNGTTKVILREAMRGILPENIRNRKDKVGYQTPEDEWFRSSQFQKIFNDVLSSEVFKKRGYFNLEKLNNLNKQHISGRKDAGDQLWKAFHLELWFRKFIDKNHVIS